MRSAGRRSSSKEPICSNRPLATVSYLGGVEISPRGRGLAESALDLGFVVGREGLEPPTPGLKVACSLCYKPCLSIRLPDHVILPFGLGGRSGRGVHGNNTDRSEGSPCNPVPDVRDVITSVELSSSFGFPQRESSGWNTTLRSGRSGWTGRSAALRDSAVAFPSSTRLPHLKNSEAHETLSSTGRKPLFQGPKTGLERVPEGKCTGPPL